MSKKILFSFASRSRPEKFFACLDNIHELIGYDNFEIVAKIDVDDVTMNNAEVLQRISTYPNVTVALGFSNNKINAVNRSLPKEGFEILCCQSDDMVFIKKDFGLDIIESFENFSGLCHFPDQQAKEKLITYAMMSKDYYDLDGHIYDERFFSVYADNWQQDLAKKRGQYKYVDKQILEHRHFIWGFGVQDELAKQTENAVVYAQDKATYDELTKTL